jgi:UDP-N-acetylglucosamine--N-acetylmuramyl-(pentapeptide) pyrophosphoryl-undecaprenol N-acetylglucosamine transferase
MKIVVTGGGSGGHITPLLAVAHELKVQQPDSTITYIGQTGDSLVDVPARDKNIDQVCTVRAGKFRRYHGAGIKQFFDLPTLGKNLRDVVWVVVGLWQSFWLLRKLRPQVVFIKGGFVGVPVGLAAAALRIPYVTHDSDALPGLANRIVAPWAKRHAVALPKEVYNYPEAKTIDVGVPLTHHYHAVSPQQMRTYREQLMLNPHGKVVLVTGGGNGALRLNEAVVSCSAELLGRYHDLQLVHIAGRIHEVALRQAYAKELSPADQKRVVVLGFVGNLYAYSAAADVVITRAGATSMAEFAAQEKPCIVVPNPILTGGHQLKNARVLADRKAARMVDESYLATDHKALLPPLVELLDNPQKARLLGKKLGEFANPDSAKQLAMILLEVAATYSRL